MKVNTGSKTELTLRQREELYYQKDNCDSSLDLLILKISPQSSDH